MTATDRPAPDQTDPGFGAAVASERIKLTTAKGPRRNLVLGSLLGIALSGLLAFAVGATFSSWETRDQLEFDPAPFAFSGAFLAGIFFVAVGVRVVTSEYSSDMIRLTLTTTPRRWRVLLAKSVVVAAATGLAAIVASVGMVVVTQLIFATFDVRTTGLGDPDTLRLVIVGALTMPVFPLLGVVAGFLFRSTAAAITTVLALMLGPSFFSGLFPRSWQENVLSLLPGPAVDSLSIGHIASSPTYLSTGPAALVTLAWIVVPLLVAHRVLVVRDA